VATDYLKHGDAQRHSMRMGAYPGEMSVPARKPDPVPELEAEDALRGVVNQLVINGERVPVIIPGSVIEALRLLAELFRQAGTTRYLPNLLPQAMPWAESLPTGDLSQFASELVEAASSGDHAPERLAAVMRAWRATAEIYDDPDEAARLRRALREADEGKATPWEYDDASI
jgi:hypothetical protein